MGFRLPRVARYRFRPATRLAHQRRRLRQFVRPPRTQHHRRALFRQQQGRCPANARRRADNGGDFAIQIQKIVLHGFSFSVSCLVTGTDFKEKTRCKRPDSCGVFRLPLELSDGVSGISRSGIYARRFLNLSWLVGHQCPTYCLKSFQTAYRLI